MTSQILLKLSHLERDGYNYRLHTCIHLFTDLLYLQFYVFQEKPGDITELVELGIKKNYLI